MNETRDEDFHYKSDSLSLIHFLIVEEAIFDNSIKLWSLCLSKRNKITGRSCWCWVYCFCALFGVHFTWMYNTRIGDDQWIQERWDENDISSGNEMRRLEAEREIYIYIYTYYVESEREWEMEWSKRIASWWVVELCICVHVNTTFEWLFVCSSSSQE